MKSRELLILAAGTSVLAHRKAIEAYIRHAKPIVIALNAQQVIEAELIDYHIACHPIRLLADADRHKVLVQPLIAPVSMFPEVMREALKNKNLLDFGFRIGTEFEFHLTYCVAPSSLVLSYALAVACSGRVSQIKLAGFDGYGSDDPRHEESERVFEQFLGTEKSISIQAITPTSYNIPASSIYALIR